MSKQKRLRLLVRHFHENGLKFVLENSGNVHDLLQLLDIQLLPRLDFSQMRIVPGCFVARDYRHLESNLVLQAPVRSQPGEKHRQIMLYILIEHQSEPDHFMPLRALEYVVMIYKRQMREWEKVHGSLHHLQLQPVLPIVLYTGTRTWDNLGSIRELVELGDELAERIPEFAPLFLNVGQTSPEILEKGGVFGPLLKLAQQRRMRLSVFEQALSELVAMLQGLAEKDRHRWRELLSYIAALIYSDREVAEQERLLQIVADAAQIDIARQEILDMGKTIAEDLIEQGRKQGKLQSRRDLLVRLLQKKFRKIPESTLQRIEATERLDLLNAWFDQAVDANKLEELSFVAD